MADYNDWNRTTVFNYYMNTTLEFDKGWKTFRFAHQSNRADFYTQASRDLGYIVELATQLS